VLGFDDGHFSEFGTFSITDWVALTSPPSFHATWTFPATVASLPKKELYILPGKVPAAIPEPYLGTTSKRARIRTNSVWANAADCFSRRLAAVVTTKDSHQHDG